MFTKANVHAFTIMLVFGLSLSSAYAQDGKQSSQTQLAKSCGKESGKNCSEGKGSRSATHGQGNATLDRDDKGDWKKNAGNSLDQDGKGSFNFFGKWWQKNKTDGQMSTGNTTSFGITSIDGTTSGGNSSSFGNGSSGSSNSSSGNGSSGSNNSSANGSGNNKSLSGNSSSGAKGSSGNNNSSSGKGSSGSNNSSSGNGSGLKGASNGGSSSSGGNSSSNASGNSNTNSQTGGTGSINEQMTQWAKQNPEMTYLLPKELGGSTIIGADGKQQSAMVDPATWPGGPILTRYPLTPKAGANFMAPSQLGGMLSEIAKEIPTNGDVSSNVQEMEMAMLTAHHGAKTVQMPANAAKAAQASQQAQGIEAGNDMGDVAKNQAASAIDYSSKFMQNFTSEEGNKWNKIRNQLFLPIGILLLLPGAILAQVKAIVNAGNPVLDDPMIGLTPAFDGIVRSIICIFLIPATYLIVNWSIDLSNSITYTIASEYQRIFGTNMYKDAVCSEMKAFPTRGANINSNAGIGQNWPQGSVNSQADFEKYFLENKKEDPCTGLQDQQNNKQDEGMPGGAMASRAISFSGNAALTMSWNILCAFQMAYLFYLFFVGPIVAALWVWPVPVFRSAFGNWVEGVVTVCFWSLFWNSTILLMACFKGVDESGTIITTALNFLATSSVKYAFDFAGLVKAAGVEATQKASQGQQGAQGGGSKGQAGAQGQSRKASQSGGQTGSAGSAQSPGAGQPSDPGADPSAPQPVSAPAGQPASAPMSLSPPNASLASFVSPRQDPMDTPIPPMTSAPPVAGDAGAQPLPSNSFVVGDGGSGSHMFTRAIDASGRPVLTVSDMDGSPVGSMPLDGMADGQSTFLNFPGGRVTAEQGSNGSQLYTASSGGHTQMVAFNGAHLMGQPGGATTSGGMHPATVNGHPGVQLAPGLFVSQDGHSFYDGDNVRIAIDNSGNGVLADGDIIHLSTTPEGDTQLSLFNANQQPLDSFVISGTGDSLNIAHVDPANRPIEGLQMTRDANGAVHSALFNALGQRTETAAINGANTLHAYFDPATQDRLGFSNTTALANGDSTTNYYRDDNSLIGTNQYQLTDNGFRETVYDAAGQPVSMQQTAYNQDGYTISSANFNDGNVSSATIAQYDQSGTFISSNSIDPRLAFADNGPLSNTSNPPAVSENGLARLSTESTAWSTTTAGVVPDGNVFGQAPTRYETNSYSSETQAVQAENRPVQQRVLPVDIAGTQGEGAGTQVTIAGNRLSVDQTLQTDEFAPSNGQPVARQSAQVLYSNPPSSLANAQPLPGGLRNPGRDLLTQLASSALLAASVRPRGYANNLVGQQLNAVRTNQSTNQSLQQQVLTTNRNAVPQNALNTVLRKAVTASTVGQKPSEVLTSALVDYHSVSDLLHLGKSNEAAELAMIALSKLSKCGGHEPQLLPLIHAFAVLFERKNMIQPAKAFQATEESLRHYLATSAPTPVQNVWGA